MSREEEHHVAADRRGARRLAAWFASSERVREEVKRRLTSAAESPSVFAPSTAATHDTTIPDDVLADQDAAARAAQEAQRQHQPSL
jgi:hypothetical protein